MEKEFEELKFLDIVGVVEEAMKILSSVTKLLASITITLLLPLSFAILSHSMITEPLSNKMITNKSLLRYEEADLFGKGNPAQPFAQLVPIYLVSSSSRPTSFAHFPHSTYYMGKSELNMPIVGFFKCSVE
ncbi:hypothetical protein SUGI_1196910 [Cryptomeria japonica]|nr:hypothetical protein SUGI_1196910 [Cryptomeria japonica]